jgi:hypothetical protein
MAWKLENLTKCEMIAGAVYGLFAACWVVLPLIGWFLQIPTYVLGQLFNGGMALSFGLAIALRIYVALKRVKIRGSVLLNVFIVMGILYAIFVCQMTYTKRSRAEYLAQQAKRPASDVNVPAEILAMAIDADCLQPYLHPEIEGRVPLVMADHFVAPGFSASKFGVPVKVVDEQEAQAGAYLKITWFLQHGALARVDLIYEVEGITAVVNFDQDSAGRWQVADCYVTERKRQ